MLLTDSYSEESYDVEPEEFGRIGLTVFCPKCKAQVFGCLVTSVMDDLCAHMDYLHSDDDGRA